MKKNLANYITCSRILGSIGLLFFDVFSLPYFILYTYCGISDALDGFVARTLKETSEVGKKLDSVSDLLFYTVMMLTIWNSLLAALPNYIILSIYSILMFRIVIYLYVYFNKKEFASEHLILNKATGLLIFLLPYLIQTKYFVVYSAFVCIIAFVAAINELVFHIKTK